MEICLLKRPIKIGLKPNKWQCTSNVALISLENSKFHLVSCYHGLKLTSFPNRFKINEKKPVHIYCDGNINGELMDGYINEQFDFSLISLTNRNTTMPNQQFLIENAHKILSHVQLTITSTPDTSKIDSSYVLSDQLINKLKIKSSDYTILMSTGKSQKFSQIYLSPKNTDLYNWIDAKPGDSGKLIVWHEDEIITPIGWLIGNHMDGTCLLPYSRLTDFLKLAIHN